VVNAKTKRKAVVNSEMKTKTAVDACSPMAREKNQYKKSGKRVLLASLPSCGK